MKENNLLDGLLYCGDCGHRISITSRRKSDGNHYTICNYYRTYMKLRLCTIHSNNYDKFERVVLDTLKEKCKKYIDKQNIKNKVKDDLRDNKNNYQIEINEVLSEINKINEQLDEIYLDKLGKKISIDQFDRVKEKLESILDTKKKRYNELLINSTNDINEDKKNKIIEKYINDFLKMETPSRELIVNLIDRIDIYEDKTINIKVCFADNG